MLDDAVKELKESEDKLSCGFTVTVNKKAGNIKTAEITFKENDEEVGKISFASESSKVTIDISSDENSIHYQMNLESNKLKSIEGRAVLHEGIVSEDEDASESRVEAEFKWEAADASNSSYSYTVKSYSGDNCVGTSTIKGTIKVDGKDSMVITVNLDFSSDESAISMPSIFSVKDITITIKAKDTAPQVPAYDNILEMSEDGIIELVTKVMSFAEVFS